MRVFKITLTRSWRDGLLIWGPPILVAVAGMVVAWWFVEPAPPRQVTMAAGAEGGGYHQAAQRYAPYFAEAGIELSVRQTAGSIENANLLADASSGVDVGLTQGGAVAEPMRGELEAVLALFYEPMWIFVPADSRWSSLKELAGRRLALGPEGSGTRAMARQMLSDTGLIDAPEAQQRSGEGGEARATSGAAPELLTTSTAQAIKALKSGDVDAVFVVMSPAAPAIQQWLAEPAIRPMQIQRVQAMDRRSDSLYHVTLYEGSVDLTRNLPERDLHLPAPAATLAVSSRTHPAVVQLLVHASTDLYRGGTLLNPPGRFPSPDLVDLPLHSDVRHHLTSGIPLLQRWFPFWLASLIERMAILLVPLAALLYPLLSAAPPMYRWSIRSRIYRWYRQLREIDERIERGEESRHRLHNDMKRLAELEKELLDVDVPLSYMEEFYHLRLHVDFIRNRLTRALDSPANDAADEALWRSR